MATVGQSGSWRACRPDAREPTPTLVNQVTDRHWRLFARNGVYPSKGNSKFGGLASVSVHSQQITAYLPGWRFLDRD